MPVSNPSFVPTDAYEQRLADRLYRHRMRVFRQLAQAKLNNPLHAKNQAVLRLFLTYGIYALNFDDFSKLSDEFVGHVAYPCFQQMFHDQFTQIMHRFLDARKSLQQYLTDHPEMASDGIMRPLYTGATEILTQINAVSATASMRQLYSMSLLMQKTQRALENPTDLANVQSYKHVCDRLSGKRSLGNTLNAAANMLLGSMCMAMMLMSLALAVTVIPIAIFPAILFAGLGTYLLVNGVKELDETVKAAKSDHVPSVAKAACSFYKHTKQGTEAEQKARQGFMQKIKRAFAYSN